MHFASKSSIALILMCVLTVSSCSKFSEWFSAVNDEALKLNRLAAEATWKMSSGNPDEATVEEAISIATIRSKWRRKVCEKAVEFHSNLKNMQSEKRQLWLLCRGVDFTSEETK